jgi:YbgC/YbaW family acyl-CoA thioester hydrolase
MHHFRFTERLRVRWSEVDPRQEVFAATYLVYLDQAVRGYFRALGVPASPVHKLLDGELTVQKLNIAYETPAHFDDVLDLGVRCTRVDHASLQFKVHIMRQHETMALADLTHILVCSTTRAVQPISPDLRELLLGFETGQPIIHVKLGAWDTLGPDARHIRTQVFIQEQGIPENMEWDNVDPGCNHAVAYNRLGLPLATGRWIEHVPGVAKIGRMAVSASVRGSGVGRLVLTALMQHAKQHGYREAVLHAQLTATDFYGRSGFVARGPVFDDVGIAHIEMVCSL